MIFAIQAFGFLVLGVLVFGAGYWAGTNDSQRAVDAARKQRDELQQEKWAIEHHYRQAAAITRALWPS